MERAYGHETARKRDYRAFRGLLKLGPRRGVRIRPRLANVTGRMSRVRGSARADLQVCVQEDEVSHFHVRREVRLDRPVKPGLESVP